MSLYNTYNTEDFKKKCKVFGIDLSEVQIEKFMDYYELLIEWNSFMNLTAITDFEEVVLKHFVDSLAVCQTKEFSDIAKFSEEKNDAEEGNSFLENKQISLVDVGTGAGFPGIPLKIIYPDLKVILLDSLNKRVKFLNTVIDKLDLKNVETIHGRAEDFAKQQSYREQYNFCVSRAVANLSTLTELCLPFVKEEGYFVSYKSEKLKEELSAGEKAIKILGGKIERQEEYLLPDTDIKRSLLMIRKVNSTPKKYPRKAGIPGKEPIS